MKAYLFYLLMFTLPIIRSNAQGLKKQVSCYVGLKETPKQILFSDTLKKSTLVYGGFKLPDGSEMYKSVDCRFYYFDVRSTDFVHRIRYTYCKNTLKLKSKYVYFYDAITYKKIYNERGNLIKNVNYNSLYHFTICNLIHKMKQKYQIDVLSPTDVGRCKSIHRGLNKRTGHKWYTIIFLTPDHSSLREVSFDGNTGKLISDSIEKMLIE